MPKSRHCAAFGFGAALRPVPLGDKHTQKRARKGSRSTAAFSAPRPITRHRNSHIPLCAQSPFSWPPPRRLGRQNPPRGASGRRHRPSWVENHREMGARGVTSHGTGSIIQYYWILPCTPLPHNLVLAKSSTERCDASNLKQDSGGNLCEPYNGIANQVFVSSHHATRSADRHPNDESPRRREHLLVVPNHE